MLETLCFHAQQAAEKALKAVLLFYSIEFPRTHNLRTLLDLLPQEEALPAEASDAAILSEYAVVSRYPGEVEAVTDDELGEAVRLAEVVLAWAEGVVGQDAPGGGSLAS
jgi:HEPN domain-containing protein